GRILGWSLIAYAPWARGRINDRRRAAVNAAFGFGFLVAAEWLICHSLGDRLPAFDWVPGLGVPAPLTSVLAIQALLSLLALVARVDARERRPGRGAAAEAEGGDGGGAAGGALRGARAFVRGRDGAVRRGAPPLRRVPDGRRGARGRPRDRSRDLARAGRAD